MRLIKSKISSLANFVFYSKESGVARDLILSRKFDQNVKRIYHYHVRKTAGSSLNISFFSEDSQNNAKLVYKKLSKNRFNHRVIDNETVFVGWDKYLLEKGDYHYGFSHLSYEEISLPANTFTVTILRDPVERVLSHFNMLANYFERNERQDVLRLESKWASSNLDDFLENIPKSQLLRQLFMFSSNYNVSEAATRISGLNCVLFTESYEEDVLNLSRMIGRELPIYRENRTKSSRPISLDQIEKIRNLMEPEYKLISEVKSMRK